MDRSELIDRLTQMGTDINDLADQQKHLDAKNQKDFETIDAAIKLLQKDEKTIENMVKNILSLRWNRIVSAVGRGNCPYAMFPLKNTKKEDACGEDCDVCHAKYNKLKRKELVEDVQAEYDLKNI